MLDVCMFVCVRCNGGFHLQKRGSLLKDCFDNHKNDEKQLKRRPSETVVSLLWSHTHTHTLLRRPTHPNSVEEELLKATGHFWYCPSHRTRESHAGLLIWNYSPTLRGGRETFILYYFLCAVQTCVGWDVFRQLLCWHGFLSVGHFTFFSPFQFLSFLYDFSLFSISCLLLFYGPAPVSGCFCLMLKS